MSGERIWLYDTTLRDGAQREGLSLSLEDKLQIAHLLDQLGVHYIEGGWPGANPKDMQFFWQMQQEPLTHARLVAFCSTRRPRTTAAADPLLQGILAAGTPWVTVFGKSWDLHVIEGLGTTLTHNLDMIADTITYLRQHQRHVFYDAEHWFDGYLANPEYALATLETAYQAGAEWLVLCDTNGGMLPHQISEIVQQVRARFPDAPIGIHTHNDSGTAVANAIAAVQSGARMVQGTINGYGERCGNADLCTLIPNLQLKLKYDCITPEQLRHLVAVSRAVSERVNLAPNDHAPYVGASAFAHKGGVHVSAVGKNPATYEHIPPEVVGNQRRVVISEQSGLSNILAKAQELGLPLDRSHPAAKEVLRRLKELEGRGYQFEAAEASFELLVREVLGQRQPAFVLHGFQVHCQTQAQGNGHWSSSVATVKVEVNGQELITAAEGNGPVSALDNALRRALVNFYPQIGEFQLSDYKVRVLDGQAGSAATTRVLVEFTHGTDRWTTVGVSTNIIEASYQAVAEGLEYGLSRLRSQAMTASP